MTFVQLAAHDWAFLLFSIKQANCYVKKTTKFTDRGLTSFFLSFIIRITMGIVSLYIHFVLWDGF